MEKQLKIQYTTPANLTFPIISWAIRKILTPHFQVSSYLAQCHCRKINEDQHQEKKGRDRVSH